VRKLQNLGTLRKIALRKVAYLRKNCTPRQNLRKIVIWAKRRNLRKNCALQDRDFLQGLPSTSTVKGILLEVREGYFAERGMGNAESCQGVICG